MENGRHPLSHDPRPSIGRGQQDGRVRLGGVFLWTRSFTYRKTERKLRIKLFDRYFSNFSQQLWTWCFLVLFDLLSSYRWYSSVVPSPPKEGFRCYGQLAYNRHFLCEATAPAMGQSAFLNFSTKESIAFFLVSQN